MPLDVKFLESRLKEFQDEEKQTEASRYLWRPKEGTQVVRIVPYKYNEKSCFIELQFYYKLAGKTYLAPCTFGKPDPILEFVKTLRESGVQAQRELAKKLEPKLRTYAPIIVRGQEEQGVKFWGFGKLVYKQLLKLTVNTKMWGDITSLTDGNDLEVEFHKISKKKTKDGQIIPDTSITPDPRKTPVVDPTRVDLVQKIKEQPDILTIWNLPEYADLKAAMDKFLNPEVSTETPDEAGEDVDETAAAETVVATAPVATAPVASSPTVVQSTAPVDFGKTFDEFFKT